MEDRGGTYGTRASWMLPHTCFPVITITSCVVSSIRQPPGSHCKHTGGQYRYNTLCDEQNVIRAQKERHRDTESQTDKDGYSRQTDRLKDR